jgi:NAD(P)-dependent dehydrogenase (short-subunit alcohol dehydrogenase family)
MEKRNATVAVIGAGDYIGAEIAKKFAAEGFTVFAGRRNGAKLEPLVREIEAAGGSIVARTLDARKEDEIIAFRSWKPPSGCSARSGRWPAIPAFSPGAKRRG